MKNPPEYAFHQLQRPSSVSISEDDALSLCDNCDMLQDKPLE